MKKKTKLIKFFFCFATITIPIGLDGDDETKKKWEGLSKNWKKN